jgi:MFS superfamily sulfate permease-like transporter
VLQGVGNLVGSFFSCIAFAASLSRSIVGKGVGGRTQLTALVSMLIIILTLLWVADFFEPLPRVSVFYFKVGYLVKSNQVCATMEIEISDCQPTIAKMFYIVIRT